MGTIVGDSSLVVEHVDVDWLRGMARREPASLYAVIDSCDERQVAHKADSQGERAVSLYRGWAERDYWAIAPYLFVVDEAMLDWIVGNLWGKPWGIFLVAPVDLASVRRHLRHFLFVEDPEGKKMYFRFYDPRVLGPFLRTCEVDQINELFGEIKSIAIPKDHKIVLVGRSSTSMNEQSF